MNRRGNHDCSKRNTQYRLHVTSRNGDASGWCLGEFAEEEETWGDDNFDSEEIVAVSAINCLVLTNGQWEVLKAYFPLDMDYEDSMRFFIISTKVDLNGTN